MGLSRAALRFLIREYRRQPWSGPVLTLGRQCLYATWAETVEICRQEGVAPRPLPPETGRTSNIPAWRGTPQEQYLSDVAFFSMLGATQVLALDCADFEGAELIHDLNQPVPAEHASRFGLIVDSGTLEHVFDVRQTLANVVRMLRSGGRVIHLSPANNYANHGFYQFSPTLFADFYQTNGFVDLQLFVAELSTADYAASAWELFAIDPHCQPVSMMSRGRLFVLVTAAKTDQSTAERIPQQAYYQRLFAPVEQRPLAGGWMARSKRLLPVGLKTFLRRCLGRVEHRKPWGTRRIGRLT